LEGKMKKTDLHRDFTFQEWSGLSFEDKREIWNHYWNPYEPDKGKATRKAIINAFCKANPDIANSALEIGYGYFGWYVGCIYLITSGTQKVPKHFSDVLVNKGTIVSIISEDSVHVRWRDVGGSDKNFKLKKREIFQPSGSADG
jgi:hypothetical protein